LKDYYEVLGVPHDATLQDIKHNYRRLVLRHHPDLNSQSEEQKLQAEERFKQIAEAYETLGNEQKRRQYDFHLSRLRDGPVNLEGLSFGFDLLRTGKGKCGRGTGRGFCRRGLGRGFMSSQGPRNNS